MSRGRPPKPTKVLELSGAFKKDPKRKKARANEPTAEGQLGDCPVERGKTLEDAYAWIKERAPKTVLTLTDEIEVWHAAKLLTKVANDKAKSADHQQLSALLGKMGMNPSDRSKLHVVKTEKPKNRWSEIG
jgi:hypothetical protein